MDDENKGMNEDRWAPPADRPERGYAGEDRAPGAPRTDEPPSDARRTAELRSDVERTRADMSETIGAIQDKLRPSNMISDAAGTVRDATVGRVKQMAESARDRFGSNRADYDAGRYGLADRIRQNPVPAALAVGSIALIAFRRGRGTGTRWVETPGAYGTTRGQESLTPDVSTSGDVSGDRWREGTDREGRSVRDMGAGLTDRVRGITRGAGGRIRNAASGTQDGVRRLMDQNPLTAAAIATALGIGVGLALPETEREREILGEAGETIVHRAQEAARGAAERVQDAAQRVTDVAGQAARRLTSE